MRKAAAIAVALAGGYLLTVSPLLSVAQSMLNPPADVTVGLRHFTRTAAHLGPHRQRPVDSHRQARLRVAGTEPAAQTPALSAWARPISAAVSMMRAGQLQLHPSIGESYQFRAGQHSGAAEPAAVAAGTRSRRPDKVTDHRGQADRPARPGKVRPHSAEPYAPRGRVHTRTSHGRQVH